MKPPRSILDKSFIYRDSATTDLKKTFAKARKQIAEEQERRTSAQAAGIAEFDSWATVPSTALATVSQIRKRK